MISGLSFLPVLLAGLYVVWQLGNYRGWRRAKAETDSVISDEIPPVALLVPYRNEAENLPTLLAAVSGLQRGGGQLEVYFIDDHSTDGGRTLVEQAVANAANGPALHSLSLADHLNGRSVVAHKKAALAYAIGKTSAEVIVTVDADCVLPETLVSDLVRCFRAGADVVLGPVLIAPPHDNLLRAFQALDFAAYQLYTASCVRAQTPTLANGACFAFRKELFTAVNGYAGLDHLPSGDDVLLLHRFANRPGVRFAWSNGPPVLTRPQPDWAALWRQRIRWAGKAGEYVSPALRYGQALAFLTALGILVALALTPVDPLFPAAGLLAWAMKAAVDYLLLADIVRHYGPRRLLRWYPPVQLIYPFYLTAVGVGALLGLKTSWKGR